MAQEKGKFGLIGLQGVRFATDGWELYRATHTALVYCDADRFMNVFSLTSPTLAKVIGQEWQVRCDNEDHIYYGYARCTGISRPARTVKAPALEQCLNDLALHFEFQYRTYGPYHVAEAKSLGRNGNSLFFDLLSLTEIAERIAEGDVRFKFLSAYQT